MFASRRLAVPFASLLLAAAMAFCQTAYAQEANSGATPNKGPVPLGPILLGPVPVSGQWIEFSHLGPGTFAMGCLQGGDPNGLLCTPSSAGNTEFGDAPPWTFTAPPQGATLTVTDAFLRGEVFEVFDFGVSIGSTSNVSPGGSCGDNPDTCLADPLTSHGVFQMKPGPHEITIKVLASAFGVGAAYFRVDPGEAKADHFVCYKVHAKDEKDREHGKDEKSAKRQVLISNQFGEQILTVEDAELLCVPSTKQVIDQMEPKDKVDAPQ
jgi:hypothetical protein